MMIPPLRIAFIPLARPTFDIPYATDMAAAAFDHLQASGLNPAGSIALVQDGEQADQVATRFAGQPWDLVILFQATFADSSMAMRLAEAFESPLLLWAVPEPHTGGRLRLNSLCGINLAGHALTRAGRFHHHIYAAPNSEGAMAKVVSLARAGRARRMLGRAQIGRVGEHPAGFETCEFDAPALKQVFGLDVVQLDLQEDVFAAVRKMPLPQTRPIWDELVARVSDLEALDPDSTRCTLATYRVLSNIAQEQNIAGFAVRCWPQFFTDLGCAACGAASLLNEAMIPASCETDVNGLVTQLMLQWISEEPAFGADIVSVDGEQDALVVWHCGKAPLSMADPQGKPGVTIHSNRRLPLLMDFTLKPGPVTVARLSHAQGRYRLIIGRGEMIGGPKSFSGTSGLLRFDLPARAVLDTILSEGLEHHIALTYGDHVDALLALAAMYQLPVLRLD